MTEECSYGFSTLIMDDVFWMGGRITCVDCTGDVSDLTEIGDFSAVGVTGDILFTVVLVSGIENLTMNS